MFTPIPDGPIINQNLQNQQQTQGLLPTKEVKLPLARSNKKTTSPEEFNYPDESELGDGFANCY